MKKTLLFCLIFSVFSALYSYDPTIQRSPSWDCALDEPKTIDDLIKEYKNPEEMMADFINQIGIFNHKNDPKFTEKISEKHKKAIAEMKDLQKKYIKEELRIKDGTLTAFPQYKYGISQYIIQELQERGKTFSSKDLPVSKCDLLLYESKDGKSFIIDSIDMFFFCRRGEKNEVTIAPNASELFENIFKTYTCISPIYYDKTKYTPDFNQLSSWYWGCFIKASIPGEKLIPLIDSVTPFSFIRGADFTGIVVSKTKDYTYDYKPYFK